VVLLQEVDAGSRRIHFVREVELMAGALPEHAVVFAKSYDVAFVPVPPASPMGRVKAGQMTLARWRPSVAERYVLPGHYGFLVQLDRASILTRFPAADGRDRVVINTHNSGFDAGQLREQQLGYIKEVVTREHEKGNYVVVGGDWNLILPGVDPDAQFPHTEARPGFYLPFPEGWTPEGWRWAYDAAVPSNRSVGRPWRPGENYATVIDGFLVSSNVEVLEVRTDDLNFADSDRNPVRVRFSNGRRGSAGVSEPASPTGRPRRGRANPPEPRRPWESREHGSAPAMGGADFASRRFFGSMVRCRRRADPLGWGPPRSDPRVQPSFLPVQEAPPRRCLGP